MKVTLQRINDDFLFEAKGASENVVRIDNKSGEVVQGSSPMELILMGVGGCNAIDIVSILKKQRQKIESYHIEVTGFRKKYLEATPFEKIHLDIFLEGEISEAKAKRAAALSFDKYCSVSLTLIGSVEVTYQLIVNGQKVK